jgi:hydrogenase maturation protease
MKKNILILGLGNVLMQDEGIGVRAVELFQSLYDVPNNVVIMDGGTTGMEIFNPIAECDYLIVVDAINSSDESGTLVKIQDEQIPAFFQTKLSNHQLGLSDVLALLKLKDKSPEKITLIAMVPFSLQNKLGLSKKATENLSKMVDMIKKELECIKIKPEKKKEPTIGHWQKEERFERTMLQDIC